MNIDEIFKSKGEISSNIEDQSNGKRRLLDNPDNSINDSFQPEADDQFIWNDNDEEGQFFGGD
ncbi:unnamed protein product [Cunninghamella echinulata]